MESLVGGAAVFGELQRVVLETIDKPTIFRSTLESLRLTLETISPLIEEIEFQNYAVDRPKREIERLIRGLEEGRKLICKGSTVRRWNYLKQMRYQKRFAAFDESLTRFFKVEMQASIVRDQRETLLAIREITEELRGPPIHGVDVTQELRGPPIRGGEVAQELRGPPIRGREFTPELRGPPIRGGVVIGLIKMLEITLNPFIFCEVKNTITGMENVKVTWENNTITVLSVSNASTRAQFLGNRRERSEPILECMVEENDAQEAKEEMEAREEDERITQARSRMTLRKLHRRFLLRKLHLRFLHNRITKKESIQRERMTIGGGVEGLNSTLQPRLVMPPSSSTSSNAGGLATLKYQNQLCYCGRKAVLCTSGSQGNSCSFYYCEKLDCGYYCETNSRGEAANHGDSVNFGNKKEKNNEFEEMSRKCGSPMQRLHSLQGTVSGLKLLTVTTVMVSFLSLIMNFVILMYK